MSLLPRTWCRIWVYRLAHDLRRLRRADVDTEHTERQAKRYEQERDQWEKKYEVRSTVLAS